MRGGMEREEGFRVHFVTEAVEGKEMRENWNTQLVGRKAVLRPYQRRCVSRYHAWMEDEWLREMTASERLTLEEEFEMQKDWRDDPNKCTFIVYDRDLESPDSPTAAMAGDVNLFFLEKDRSEAEIMVMTAEPASRRKGMGSEAALLMIRYGVEELGVKRFTAKISDSNEASIQMFTRLGFGEPKTVAVFSEVHLHLDATDPTVLEYEPRCRVMK